MESPIDIAVLGGGPAGAAAARLLAGWGLPVTVLTRPPRQPPLVESLPPSTTRLLDRLGLREAVDKAGFLRSAGNTAWWGDREPRCEPFGPGLLGYQVPRADFDALLLDQARAGGATVLRNVTVRSVSAAGPDGTRSVEYELDGARHVLGARWVLDCTGRSGLVARQGWRKPESGQRTTALVATWEQPDWPVDDPTHTLVESCGDGWAWSVPESTTRRQVAVMVDPSVTSLSGGVGLIDSYLAELAQTSHLGPMLRTARMVEEPWARDASPYSAFPVGEPGLLLVGDAASFSDPLSSFGVKKALASAWLAAVVVRSALDDPAIGPHALEFYQRREHDITEALRRRAAEFASEATQRHAGEYWVRRLADTEVATPSEPDVTALRQDADVLAALAELKRRDRIALRPGAGASRATRPSIRQDRIILQDHLVVPAFPSGIRWLRDLDLVRLADLAPGIDQVPTLYDRYNATGTPAPLPDFLGALAVLVGKGILDFA